MYLPLVVSIRDGQGEHPRRRVYDRKAEGPISPMFPERADKGIIPGFERHYFNDKDEASYSG